MTRNDSVGYAVDRLVTVEIKNRAMPRDFLDGLLGAAQASVGGRPVTMLAAEKLKAAVAPGDVVLLLTGAGVAPSMPKGESDGPPGVAALARTLYRGLGAHPVYICEANHADPIIASSEAAGVMVREFDDARDHRLGASIIVAPTYQEDVGDWIEALFARTAPKAVLASERLGRSIDGGFKTATALPLPPVVVDIAGIIDRATRDGLPTIGVGDHGNEIGFGRILEDVRRLVPRGGIIATTVATDVVVPALASNFGCYGIEACLAYLIGDARLMHSPEMERRILQHCLDAGGLEAINCSTEFFVDGVEGESSMAIVQLLGNIVRKNLEHAGTGLIH